VIVRSPAYADVQNCGTPVGLFKNAGCAILPIQQTFMLQFCCGDGDCSDAGANGKMVRGVDRNMIPRSGSSGYQFKYANGTVIVSRCTRAHSELAADFTPGTSLLWPSHGFNGRPSRCSVCACQARLYLAVSSYTEFRHHLLTFSFKAMKATYLPKMRTTSRS
jgi:hypothetical protein